MNKIKCILVEDEQPAVEIFRSYLEQYNSLELIAFFNNIPDLQKFLAEKDTDVLFLDIQLPGMSGMDFLENVKVKPLVIITSAYSEHAVKAFEVDAFDYLLKPYSPGRFIQTVQKIMTHFNENEIKNPNSDFILIKSSLQTFKINIDQILFIESKREYMHFITLDGEEISSRLTVQECLDKLPYDKFVQTHRSFIVNLDKITSVESDQLNINGKTVPIGDLYKLNFKKIWEKR